jgi:DnaJ-class molecular chaperone
LETKHNYDGTETENERIARGEEVYDDDSWEICPACKGAGCDQAQRPCYYCNTLGEVKTEDALQFERSNRYLKSRG